MAPSEGECSDGAVSYIRAPAARYDRPEERTLRAIPSGAAPSLIWPPPLRDLVCAQVVGAAFSVAADCKLRLMADKYSHAPNILLLQPEIGELIRALDFSHGRRLVEAGYEYSLPRIRERLAEWEVDSLRKANRTHPRLP